MIAVMNVEPQHVSLVEVSVPKRSLSPVIVADLLLPNFASLTADGDVPVPIAAERDKFEGVPKVLAQT
jgi:hypothetical protein